MITSLRRSVPGCGIHVRNDIVTMIDKMAYAAFIKPFVIQKKKLPICKIIGSFLVDGVCQSNKFMVGLGHNLHLVPGYPQGTQLDTFLIKQRL